MNEREQPEDGGSNAQFVILLRHGIAEDKSEEKPDEDRELTGNGHARMKKNAQGLARIFPKADALYSSPLVRAVQTGMWVTKAYGGKLTLETIDALRHESDPAEIVEFVRSLSAPRVILAGHEPHLTRTMAYWTGIGVTSFELRKGGCYCLRVEDSGPAALEWMLPPRILRRMA